MLSAAVGFGLLAALLNAGSASLQQHAAQRERARVSTVVDRPAHRAAIFIGLLVLFQRLLREPMWVVGWWVNLVGFGAQALALHYGSLALVQPLLVTQLLFALPMASAWLRRWPGTLDWIAALLICGGLAIFLTVGGVAPIGGEANRLRLAFSCVAAGVGVVVLLVLSAGFPRLVRATLIALASGLCFAVSAAMIKLTTDNLVNRGVAATATDWPGYALVVSTVSGLLLEQGAFAAGSLPSAVAAMSISNPVTSYAIGVFAFGVPPPEGAGSLAGLAGAGALISAGTVGLARSPIVRFNPG